MVELVSAPDAPRLLVDRDTDKLFRKVSPQRRHSILLRR